MSIWPVQDAKARFSELLQESLRSGPQVVTLRGVKTAVLVPYDEWERMANRARPDLKELLLGPAPRGPLPVLRRSPWRLRAALKLE
jgi:prevent-host-death family protein